MNTIDRQLTPNSTTTIELFSPLTEVLSCYPVFEFVDSAGDKVAPTVGTVRVEISQDGLTWQNMLNGLFDYTRPKAGMAYHNGYVRFMRITSSALVGIIAVNFKLHLNYHAQHAADNIVAESFVSRNIKRGRQFNFFTEIALAANETKYIASVTGDETVTLKFRLLTTDGGMRYTPRSGAAFTQGTEITTVRNPNGYSDRVSKTKFYNANAVINEGVAFDLVRSSVGQGNQRLSSVFGGSIDYETIIKPATQSLLKFENLESKAVYVVLELSYYEGPVDLQL